MRVLHDPAVRSELESRLAREEAEPGRRDAAERAKCRTLIGKPVSKPIDGAWPVDPSFGPVDGTFVSRLQAKHLDHHFRQFGG